MALNVGQMVSDLRRMTVTELRRKYAEVFGEPARSGNRQWLFRRVAWRLQALAEGDLPERARARARELARDADAWLPPPTAAAHACRGPVLRARRPRTF